MKHLKTKQPISINTYIHLKNIDCEQKLNKFLRVEIKSIKVSKTEAKDIKFVPFGTFIRGVTQLVVQLAMATTLCSGLYSHSFTPITNIGASLLNPVMITFFAPPLRCAAARSLSV